MTVPQKILMVNLSSIKSELLEAKVLYKETSELARQLKDLNANYSDKKSGNKYILDKGDIFITDYQGKQLRSINRP